MRPLPQVLVLWGVPGAGKSYFAEWLANHKGFARIDTHSMGAGSSPLEWSWYAVLNGQAEPETFVKLANAYGSPVVLEYGLWANRQNIERLSRIVAAGAEAWWFDGDREAACQSWRQANATGGKAFPEDLWAQVVGVIDANCHLLTALYGGGCSALSWRALRMHRPRRPSS